MSKTIVIVEDTPVQLKIIEYLLAKSGYQVRGFLSARRALEFLDAIRPDLLILDMMMPDIDGLTALRRIRSDPRFKDLKVVIFTSKDFTQDRREAEELGISAYITKDTASDMVVKTISDILGEGRP